MRVTNIGSLGNPFFEQGRSFDPSFEFPRGSGVEGLKHADLWVGAPETAVRFDRSRPASIAGGATRIGFGAGELVVRGDAMNARLFDLRGSLVAEAVRTAPDASRIGVSHLPAATYVLGWREAGRSVSRFVNLCR